MYAKLIEATKLIAYDNGAINRHFPEDEVVRTVMDSLQFLFSAGELEAAENFLAHLSQEDLVELCTGEYGAVPSTELVEAVLEKIFENM